MSKQQEIVMVNGEPITLKSKDKEDKETKESIKVLLKFFVFAD